MAEILREIDTLRACVKKWRQSGHRIGLVPTMGALHAGHISLIKDALGDCDRVITTIFVNPTQFGANEDLKSYPRDEGSDVKAIKEAGGHIVFAPDTNVMYPDGFATRVEVDGLTDVLDGKARPGHFDGVTQIVAKLLNQAQADVAVFGEKDWQQLTIVRRMARDLDIATEIRGAPIIRDAKGLALSSRNTYLSETELKIAQQLNKIIRRAAADIAENKDVDAVCEAAKAAILAAGFNTVDYLECRDAETLAQVETLTTHRARVFVAAKIGKTRLIDNIAVIAP